MSFQGIENYLQLLWVSLVDDVNIIKEYSMNNHLLQDQWPIKIPQNFYLLNILLFFNKALPEPWIIIWQHGQAVRALDL